MLTITGGPFVYMNYETGELWAKFCLSLHCFQCSATVIKTIDVPFRNNVFVGCKLCKNTMTQVQFQLT